MSWHNGNLILESIIIGAYDLGKLDKELFKVCLTPFTGFDIDWYDMDVHSSYNKKTYDGKEFYQLLIETFDEQMPVQPSPDDEEAWIEYNHEVYAKVQKILTSFDMWPE